MAKKILVKARINKANGQINFNIKKNSLPKSFKDKLSKLKDIKLDLDDFGFDLE